MASSNPLILTLALDPATQQFFDDLRTRYFPPERNFLRAHCTLFHTLPGSEQAAIEDDLHATAAGLQPLPLQVAEVKFIGKGVAYSIHCPQAKSLHQALQRRWMHWLNPQDAQGLWPHVTVQNKVQPDVARKTHAVLAAGFTPFSGLATGLNLWEYRGGPWDAVRSFPFSLL